MGERLSSMFSPDGILISASATPHCGDTADGAPVGTECQSRTVDGKDECRCVFFFLFFFFSGAVGISDLSMVYAHSFDISYTCMPIKLALGAVVLGFEQTCSGLYVDKSVPDFVHHADLVCRSLDNLK